MPFVKVETSWQSLEATDSSGEGKLADRSRILTWGWDETARYRRPDGPTNGPARRSLFWYSGNIFRGKPVSCLGSPQWN